MAIFYKVSVALNTAIMLFSLVIVITSSVFIRNYSDADFLFSVGDFLWLLTGGLLGVVVSIMGCCGARDPVGKYNLLFCYFFFLSLNLLFFGIGFYLYRVFVNDLEAAADGDVETAFRLESAKEFNDLILSVYTTCCTGCLAVGEFGCQEVFEPLFEPNPCGEGSVNCTPTDICDSDERLTNGGLDQGCIINSKVSPSYTIGDNFCIFFSEFATDAKGSDIVGPVEQRGCGSGLPKTFVDRVGQFVGKNYLVIASFWGIALILLFVAWLAALFMLLCPHRYEDWNRKR